jgi:poly-gamma-glutamate biosynthesis protein PgsC/CapC
MISLLPLAIGLGLAVSLLSSELFGLAAGGMIVPGYFALAARQPLQIVLTLLTAAVTYGMVVIISQVLILYGRRRTTLMILVGFLLGLCSSAIPWQQLTHVTGVATGFAADTHTIGFIIPGLIAIWFERQGPVETLCSLATASVIVRLVLILCVGPELLP